MPSNDRMICITKIDQSLLAVDKIETYLADIAAVLAEDEKRFQRKHPELRDKVDMVAQIALQTEQALKLLRSEF